MGDKSPEMDGDKSDNLVLVVDHQVGTTNESEKRQQMYRVTHSSDNQVGAANESERRQQIDLVTNLSDNLVVDQVLNQVLNQQ